MRRQRTGVVLLMLMVTALVTAGPLNAAEKEYSIYVVDSPISNQTILPGRPLPPICKQGKLIQVRACPGEYEPASFVVVTKQPLQSVRIEVDALTGPAGTLAKEAVDVRIARPLAPRFPKENIPGSAPVLLVKDDSLLTREPDPHPEYPGQEKDVWPHGSRDAKELLPVRIDNLTQFWITVHVPADARPGSYSASLRVVPDKAPASELTLRLEVYAFHLLPPMLDYSIYYPAYAVPEGSEYEKRIGEWRDVAWLSPKQYLAELENMVAHGLANPFCYGTTPAQKPDGTLDFATIEYVLALREKAGMCPGRPLYMNAPNAAEPRLRPLTDAEKKETSRLIREVMAWGRQRGYPEIYFMALDEQPAATLVLERDSFQAIRDGGGKNFVAEGGFFYDMVADLLDLPVMNAGMYDRQSKFTDQLNNPLALPDKAERAKAKAELEKNYESWMIFDKSDAGTRGIIDGVHRRGNRIFPYMHPMAGSAMPEVHRRNNGLGLWQAGFDGCMNWSYIHAKGSVTNPSDHMFWSYVVRTEDGVIDKVEWEGFREGVDDVRYLTTLMDVLNRRAGTYGKDPLVVETWAWLGNLDAAKDDLNAIRAAMARRIVALHEMGEKQTPLREIPPETLSGAPKGEKWDVEFTGDGLPWEQGWTGDSNSGFWSPNYPAGFFRANGNPGGQGEKAFGRPLAGYGKAGGWTVEWALRAMPEQNVQPFFPQDTVFFNDDTNILIVRYTKKSVILKGHTEANAVAEYALKLDAYHIYRLVRRPGSKTVELYVDNNAKPVLSITPAAAVPPASNLNSVRWCNSAFASVWDFFRYHKGATVPTGASEEKAEQSRLN